MSVAPLAQTAAKRQIGDILLDLGFATPEAIAEAVAEQEQTGQPLGQILVMKGAITRLELASALAEQWSDQSASISLLPVPSTGPRVAPPQHQDDDQYAARLQEAVAQLAERVHQTEPGDAVADRVTDLAERVEATVARTQRLEATLATLAESFEGVTGGVEEAFGALQEGVAGLALDLARIDTTVAEIVASPPEPQELDPALADQLVRLDEAVQDLAGRPDGGAELEASVAAIASRLDSLVDGAVVDALRVAISETGERIDALAAETLPAAALTAHAETLEELRATVALLVERPASSPDIDARLQGVEAELANRLGALAQASDVQSLEARLDAAAVLQEQGAQLVEALGLRLDGLAATGDPDPGTTARLDALTASIDELAAALEEMRQGVADAAATERPGAGEIEELRGALTTLRAEVASLDLSSTAENVVTPRELEEALSSALDGLTAAPPATDERVDRVEGELAALTARLEAQESSSPAEWVQGSELEALAARLEALGAGSAQDIASLRERLEQVAVPTPADGALAVRLDALEARINSDLVTPGELNEALARAREELAPTEPAADARIEALSVAIDELRAQLNEIGGRAGDVEDVHARITNLGERIDSHAPGRELTDRLAALESRLATELAARPPAPDHTRRLEQIEDSLGALVERASGDDRPPTPDPGVTTLLATLADRLEALEQTIGVDLATVGAVEQAIDGLRSELIVPPTRPATTPEGFEGELERTRMAIERLGHQLSGHDRAIKELMASHGGAKGEPTYGQGAAAPETASDMRSLIRRMENAEDDARADREKLMMRLERMATSIDWRLQRLEGNVPE